MKEKKKRSKRDLSPVFEERRVNKRRLLKLAKETFSSNTEDETSVITAEPMNIASPIKAANKPTRALRPRERGIEIREPIPQVQQEQQAKVEALDGNEDPKY